MAAVQRLELAADPARLHDHVGVIFAALPVRWRLESTRVGLAEALANAILHGALGLGTRTDLLEFLDAIESAVDRIGRSASLRVHVSCRQNVVCVRLRDPGHGFDWRRTAARPGRGLALMLTAFRSIRWNRRGNVVELTLRSIEESK